MSRARVALAAAALATVMAGQAGQADAVPDAPVHVARAFTSQAEAYPMESAPGSQQTTISARPAATKAVVSNPPVDAFARAAAADLGLAEAYVGQQGPSADADTATQGGDNDVVIDEGGSHMEVHVDPAPRASATATGNAADGDPTASGSAASASRTDGSAKRLVAYAEAEVHDFRAGLLFLGSGRFEGRASIDGTPGGGAAEGVIRTSDATFDGIPIILGADGVRVDESRLPDPMVRAATAAIQQAFAPGGYADIRVVQPKIEISADGTSARVYGGGVLVFMTNNDPAERYFFSYTLLGGSAEVFLGGELSQPTPDRTTSGGPVNPVSSNIFSPPRIVPPVASSAAPASPPAPKLVVAEGAERIALRGLWAGWAWVLVLVAGAWVGAGALRLPPMAPIRRRLDRVVDSLADRYLRG